MQLGLNLAGRISHLTSLANTLTHMRTHTLLLPSTWGDKCLEAVGCVSRGMCVHIMGVQVWPTVNSLASQHAHTHTHTTNICTPAEHQSIRLSSSLPTNLRGRSHV